MWIIISILMKQMQNYCVEKKINKQLYSITVMLVNDEEEKSNGTRCLFQPMVKVVSEVNGFKFREYSSLVDFNVLDSEEQSLELQYRNKHVYGTGLGTSVNWNIDSDGNGEIYNDFSQKWKSLQWISLFHRD